MLRLLITLLDSTTLVAGYPAATGAARRTHLVEASVSTTRHTKAVKVVIERGPKQHSDTAQI